MNAPPGNKSGWLSRKPSRPRRIRKLARRNYFSSRRSASLYWQLIVARYLDGLLSPFACSGCGALALDPIGFDGPQRPLCDACADPEGRDR